MWLFNVLDNTYKGKYQLNEILAMAPWVGKLELSETLLKHRDHAHRWIVKASHFGLFGWGIKLPLGERPYLFFLLGQKLPVGETFTVPIGFYYVCACCICIGLVYIRISMWQYSLLKWWSVSQIFLRLFKVWCSVIYIFCWQSNLMLKYLWSMW